jgi:hypothetical protein
MSKKSIAIISIMCLLLWGWPQKSLAGGQAYFRTSGLWRVASNWATWDGAQLPPATSDHANLNNGNVHCTINLVTTAVCARLTLPNWQNFVPAVCYLDMTGGVLQVYGNFEIGNWNTGSQVDRGEFNISSGDVYIWEDLSIGDRGFGTVNMDGGTITAWGTLYIPKNPGGTGRLNLDGGIISVHGLDMNAGGWIDIGSGTLMITGDKRAMVNNHVLNGWITAHDKTGMVIVNYDSATNRTIVTGAVDYFLLDNFELYTDSANLRASWHDSSNSGVNTSVGLETEIVHSGGQSMICAYDNSGATHYSEIYREYSSAQDWTIAGAKVLGLFFHGSQTNNAEQMYVIVEDSVGGKANATYSDSNGIIQQKGQFWKVWNIKLQDFNDSGVDLSNVKKIILGFGDKNSSQAGGVGVVYLDDIRLSAALFADDYSYTPSSDFSGDAVVNFTDYAKEADAWQAKSNEPDFNEICDLDGNGAVNFNDLAIFADNWLWPMEQVLITVDANAIKGDISTLLTGVNMSFCYDTDQIWDDGGMAGYLRDANVAIMRFPGGGETSKYHWEYPGVPVWADAWDPTFDVNDYASDSSLMSVDDYIRQCRAVGAEPLVGVNIQSGKKYNRIQDSINEALRLMQYCRDQNYNVKYWYLDNEPYYANNAEAMTIAEWTGYVKQFAPAMKAFDPNIKIVVNWQNELSEPNYWSEWEYLLTEAGEYFDVADVHWYWGWSYATWDLWLNENPMKVREWCGNCPNQKYVGPSYVDEIQGFYNKIKNVNGKSYNIKLAALEWNIAPVKDYRFSQFQHALMQSEMLGQFIEGRLHAACQWPLTWSNNLWGDFRAILDQDKHQPTPSSLVFELYSHALGQKLITSTTSLAHVRPVSVLAADGNMLWLYLLHKSEDGDAARAQVSVNGFTAVNAEAITFTAPAVSSDVGGLEKIVIRNNPDGKWECVLPPYSLTMLTFHKNN